MMLQRPSVALRSQFCPHNYNNAFDDLSKLSGFQTPCKLEFQLNGSVENASRIQKAECVTRATEVCMLVCNVIAPDDGETLFNLLHRKEVFEF